MIKRRFLAIILLASILTLQLFSINVAGVELARILKKPVSQTNSLAISSCNDKIDNDKDNLVDSRDPDCLLKNKEIDERNVFLKIDYENGRFVYGDSRSLYKYSVSAETSACKTYNGNCADLGSNFFCAASLKNRDLTIDSSVRNYGITSASCSRYPTKICCDRNLVNSATPRDPSTDPAQGIINIINQIIQIIVDIISQIICSITGTCPIPPEPCPVGTNSCPDGTCKADCNDACPPGSNCGPCAPGQLMCPDGICRANCEPCPTPGQVRCADGECKDYCSPCPPDQKLCPSGECVSQGQKCKCEISTGDGTIDGEICDDGVCRADCGKDCDIGQVLCPDGTCQKPPCSGAGCLGECPIGTVKCEDCSCKSNCDSCPIGTVRCVDGTCRPNCNNVCPPGTFLCADGQCRNNCNAGGGDCPDKLTLCPDGFCKLNCDNSGGGICPNGKELCRDGVCRPNCNGCENSNENRCLDGQCREDCNPCSTQYRCLDGSCKFDCEIGFICSPMCSGTINVKETEINDDFNQSQKLIPTNVCTINLISADISNRDDIDLYSIGCVRAGNRLIVNIRANQQGNSMGVNTVAAILDSNQDLLDANDDRSYYGGVYDPYISFVTQENPNGIYLGVAASYVTHFGSENGVPEGSYDIQFTRETNVPIPAPNPQVVWLDFEGGDDVQIAGEPIEHMRPFSAESISPRLAGQTDYIIDRAVELMRQDYAPYKVTLFDSRHDQEPTGPHSSVFFGNINERFLGIADNVDTGNRVLTQEAIVFTEDISYFEILQPSVDEVAQIIANVGSHELGHLLGLQHVTDQHDIMGTAITVQQVSEIDAEFLRSPILPNVFPLGFQNSPKVLRLNVGVI